MKIALRSYQRTLFNLARSGHPLVVLPTGAGKSVVAAALAVDVLARGGRVLALSHRRELVNMMARRLRAAGVHEEQVGIIRGGVTAHPDRPVQVASRDSMVRRGAGDFDLVIVDEAHLSASPTYRKILARYPNARRVGFTATPYRLDSKPLGGELGIFDRIIAGPTTEVLAAAGFVSIPRVWMPSAPIDTSGVRRSSGEFNERDLDARFTVEISSCVVDEYERHAKGLRAVAFCINRRSAKLQAERFCERGIPAEYIDGDTSDAQRDALLARVESGATLVVCNCDVLAEGWDMPAIRCVILARPTTSKRLVTQWVGRCMRPGAVPPVVLDHAGAIVMHDSPHLHPGGWTLTTMPVIDKGTKFAQRCSRHCKACGEVLRVTDEVDACPSCGAALPNRDVIENGTPLVEMLRELALPDDVTATMVRSRIGMGWSWDDAISKPKKKAKLLFCNTRCGAYVRASKREWASEWTCRRCMRSAIAPAACAGGCSKIASIAAMRGSVKRGRPWMCHPCAMANMPDDSRRKIVEGSLRGIAKALTMDPKITGAKGAEALRMKRAAERQADNGQTLASSGPTNVGRPRLHAPAKKKTTREPKAISSESESRRAVMAIKELQQKNVDDAIARRAIAAAKAAK